MAHTIVLIITALNGEMLCSFLLIAAGEDSSAGKVDRVWLFGYPWILVLLIAAIVLASRGKRSIAIKNWRDQKMRTEPRM